MPEDRLELIRRVVELHQRANRTLGRYAPERWMSLALTIAQLKSLFFISGEKRTNFKRLAEALGVSPSSVTGIVDRLLEQGLVSRQENPDDRRVLLLQTTGKAETLLNDLRESTASQMSAILGHMRPDELSSLAEGLDALIRAGEAYREERPVGTPA